MCDYLQSERRLMPLYIPAKLLSFTFPIMAACMAEIEFVDTPRGGRNLFHAGYKYRVCKYLQIIRREQSVVEIKLAQLRNGATVRPKKRQRRNIEMREDLLRDRYLFGEYTTLEYLDHVSVFINLHD